MFENDVKIYGIQTKTQKVKPDRSFENDVKIYGIQTCVRVDMHHKMFENDVKIYGIQTNPYRCEQLERLRMM